MKKTTIALFTAAALGAASLAMAHNRAASKNGEMSDKAVTGEIVDLACYLAHGARGSQHADCAKKCLADGAPMGLLTARSSLFLLVNDHQHQAAYNSAKDMASEMVKVTGDVSHKGGLKALIVEKVEKADNK